MSNGRVATNRHPLAPVRRLPHPASRSGDSATAARLIARRPEKSSGNSLGLPIFIQKISFAP
ncbi:hypothetical protein BURPSS13_N0083 [Burkholderia pseudomallei S13]|nr:hypothetical protein BURPSS13_N0083 [Burkholderia pseudomallei S13]